MKALEQIELDIRSLPREELVQLSDWFAAYIEDQLDLQPEFIASIERGKADLSQGRTRVVVP